MKKPNLILRQIAACETGIAMVEFAIAIPVFLLLLLAGLELTNLAFTHMRINQIAVTVSDNAGRVRSGIDETNIYEVFAGAQLIGDSLNFAQNGRVVLSSLEPNLQTGNNAGQMINWQRCYGALAVTPSYGVQGAGRTNASLSTGMGPAGNRITAADGTAVMFVEVSFRYQPLVFTGLPDSSRNIRYETAFNVRERTNQNITNTQSLTLRAC